MPAGDPQLFTFNPSWSATDFQLAHATTPNDSGPLAPGAYSIVETAQTGWTPTSTVCTSSIGDTETAGSLELDAGETITCVFTNTKQGSIITDKVTVPAGDPQLFTFNPSWSATDFQLAHATTPNDSGPLAPGAYSIVENAQTGWTPTSTVCTSSIGGTVTAGSLELDAGETITCVFTNTKQGSIITDKVTVPAGDPQLFTFNPSWSATDFQLAHATTPNDSGPLAPGAYSIVENAQTGWTPTSTVCTSSIGDTETAGSLELDAGETITCVFTNTKQGSSQITDKVTVPAGDPQLFTFNPSWSATDFQLAHAATPNDSGPLAPGAYSIVENAQTGWTPTSTVCTSSIGTPRRRARSSSTPARPSPASSRTPSRARSRSSRTPLAVTVRSPMTASQSYPLRPTMRASSRSPRPVARARRCSAIWPLARTWSPSWRSPRTGTSRA